ncbi:MAG: hypothetical protein KatS3mg095_0724 [Candidatus Parcubacteria bacterium]|nr:MAG: hypothetical protein KatS3mg095_0724 [Candidatus Parcubacteria bacterium]
MKFCLEVLPSKTKDTISKLSNLKFISNFYLAGGTGLALQFGHRLSKDLDFFSQSKFSEEKLIKELCGLGKFELNIKDQDTIIGFLNKQKVSFFVYEYPLLRKTLSFQKIKIAHFVDIGCMKISAISSRGTKRDFIDLYFILQKIDLEKLLKAFKRKYKNTKFNMIHLYKSLIYFKDADNEPLPVMIKNVKWQEIKKFFIKTIKDSKVKKI